MAGRASRGFVGRRTIFAAAMAALAVARSGLGGTVSLTENSSTNWTITNGNITAIFDPSSDDVTSVKLGSSANLLNSSSPELDEEFAAHRSVPGPRLLVPAWGQIIAMWMCGPRLRPPPIPAGG